MASGAAVSVNVVDTDSPVVVPADDVARIMYYLHCVTVGLGLDILPHDLIDFSNYTNIHLAPDRLALLFKYASEFSPDELTDKLIFLDDDREVVTESSGIGFCDISAACGSASLQQRVVIAGKAQNVTKAMFFTSAWLEKYYTGPVSRVGSGTWHCTHCNGRDDLCACTDCPRTTESRCQSYLDYVTNAMSETTISSAFLALFPSTPVGIPDAHQCNCDGCGQEWPEGTRYRCTICDNYDLCDRCYANDDVHDLSHPFQRIDRPGMTPVRLAPRSSTAHDCVCDGCRRQGFDGIRYRCEVCDDFDLCKTCYHAPVVHDLAHVFVRIDRPGSLPVHLDPRAAPSPPPTSTSTPATPTLRPLPLPPRAGRELEAAPSPPPPPPPLNDPPPSYASATSTDPFFYHDMTTAELNAYLTERDVAHGDIRDHREALCRRVWETHCDGMGVAELGAFLCESGVLPVLAGDSSCGEVASRRERAREAFQASRVAVGTPAGEVESRPRIVVMSEGGGGFWANDLVMLTGLSRGEMNGRRGRVVRANCGGGRAEVRLEESGRVFKVKFVNLAVVPKEDCREEFLD